MYLTSIIASGNNPYLEYAWVCPPNGAGQSITANTITTLSCDTRVSDFYGYGAINPSTSQLTLSAGTYFFEAHAWTSTSANQGPNVMSLYNLTLSSYITRGSGTGSSLANGTNGSVVIRGQFTTTSINTFVLTFLGGVDVKILNNTYTISSLYGATTLVGTGLPSSININADQRTTIKLWKLA